MVPAIRISPIAKAILNDLTLLENAGDGSSTDSNNYVLNEPKIDKFASWAVRGDQAWNNNNHSYLEFRYNNWTETFGDPCGPSNVLQTDLQGWDNYGLTLNHAWVISPKLLLTLLGNATVHDSDQGNLSAGLNPANYGFPASLGALQGARGVPEIQGLEMGTLEPVMNFVPNQVLCWSVFGVQHGWMGKDRRGYSSDVTHEEWEFVLAVSAVVSRRQSAAGA